MGDFWIFLAKASFAVLVVWGSYRIFLNGQRNFQGSRAFILSALVLGLIMSWVEIPVNMGTQLNPDGNTGWESWWANMEWYSVQKGDHVVREGAKIHASTQSNWLYYLLLIYFAGALIATIRMTGSLFSLYQLVHGCEKRQDGHLSIFTSPKLSHSFSFFNFIFLGKELEPFPDHYKGLVIAHESVHARQLHSLDLIFIEIFGIIFWFHPAIFYLKKSLREIHEYIADREVSRLMGKHPYSRLLIFLNHHSDLVLPVNHFAHSQTKNRIMMVLTKEPSQRRVFIAPVALFLLSCLAIACTPEMQETGFVDSEKEPIHMTADISQEKPDPSPDIPSLLPVQGRITAEYGITIRIDDFQKRHFGIDFGAATGTPVYATANGKVVVAGTTKETAWGKQVRIQHVDHLITAYAHLDEVLVEQGQEIKKGSLIGKVGNTGGLVGKSRVSTGPHLHYGIQKDGKWVDPNDYMPKP